MGNDNRGSLLMRIMELDFSIHDVTLYLCMYPACCAATEYRQKLEAERAEVVEKYNRMCPETRGMPWHPDFGTDR